MKPTLPLRMSASLFSEYFDTSVSPKMYWPLVGASIKPDDVEQRRLAAAGWAHHRDELALAELEVDAVERRRLELGRAIALRDLR